MISGQLLNLRLSPEVEAGLIIPLAGLSSENWDRLNALLAVMAPGYTRPDQSGKDPVKE